MCDFQQVVALVHLHAQGFKRLHHLVHIGDDGLVGLLCALHLCQEVLDQGIVQAELHLLGIHHYQFELCGMLLVEK